MEARKLIDKFIYSCSHDLRAPVASIQGLVRIAEYYPHHEETHKCLEMIESCTVTLDKLIRRLEEFMINDDRPVQLEQLNTTALTREIEPEFRNQLEACHIELLWDINMHVPWRADVFSLQKILRYLISNSIAYHDPAKARRKITIRLESRVEGVSLEVSDNGVGIAEDQLIKLFEIFERGSEKSIGLGMGLFLTKGLADKMGAEVSVRSRVKEGTTFLFAFPHTAQEIESEERKWNEHENKIPHLWVGESGGNFSMGHYIPHVTAGGLSDQSAQYFIGQIA